MTTTTTTARRIQLRRTKGWRKPDGAIVVARPGKWGNRHPVGKPCPVCGVVHDRAAAVAAYRADLARWTPQQHAQARADLTGRDLACWCRLDEQCHADVLLELVNRKETT